MSRRFLPDLTFLISILFLITACTQNELLSSRKGAVTPAAQQQQFQPVSDVPIPKDAELDAERSLILSRTDDWTGRLVMTSSLTATETFAFYKLQMPRFDWNPIMSVQSAVSVMSFTRAGRAATVQVERRALGGTRITVTVARTQDTVRPLATPPVRKAPLDQR